MKVALSEWSPEMQVGKEVGVGNCVWAGGEQRPNRQLVFAN